MSSRQVGGGRRVRRGVVAIGAVCASLALAGIAGGGTESAERVEDRLSRKQRDLVELGRRLFFEPGLSALGTNSCASCHDPAHGFGDPRRVSADDVGMTLRHSQSLIDVDLSADQHWDGEFLSVAAIVEHRSSLPSTPEGYGRSETTPLPGRREPRDEEQSRLVIDVPDPNDLAPKDARTARLTADLGLRDGAPLVVVRTGGPHARVVARLGSDPVAFASLEMARLVPDSAKSGAARVTAEKRYEAAMFGVVAAGKDRALTVEAAGEAIEAYVATLRSSRSPYDRHRAGEKDALSESAQRGLALFRGAAGCVACHKESGEAGWPLFRDGSYHNTGVSWITPLRGSRKVLNGLRLRVPEGETTDAGRHRFLTRGVTERAFKTPSLRDVARHPPYMHDGSKETLLEVVEHYASGCGTDPERDERLKGFKATRQDLEDLVAFLEALTSEARPGEAPEAWSRRQERTKVRVVDGLGEPLPDLSVGLTTAGDHVPAKAAAPLPLELVTNARGEISFAVPGTTHVCLKFPDGIEPSNGALVPDTCASTTVRLPVFGRVSMAFVLTDPTVAAPAELRAYVRMPGDIHKPAVLEEQPWVFVREGVVTAGDTRTAVYQGWRRSAADVDLVLRLPGQRAPQQVHLDAATQSRRVDVDAAGTDAWRALAR